MVRGRTARDPVRFAEEVLGLKLWPKQAEILCQFLRYQELVLALGRRSGKSLLASIWATYDAIFGDYEGCLRPDEPRYIVCVATSRDQATIVHRDIHDHRWKLQRSDQELIIVDPQTGELIMRRLFNRDFDAPAFFHQLSLSEDCLERLIHDVPYLTDDQLVEAFASAHSLGKRAWIIQAAILYEAQRRSVYGDHSLEAIARRFDISLRQAQKYALVWKLYFRDGVNVDAILLNEPSWYVVAASESSDPEFWLGHAQDRKAQDPRYSVAEFREDIRLGKEAIEAGIETRVPPCPWQTTYCEKVLELITSDRRCRDCTVGQRLLGIAKEEQLTASNPIP